MATGFSKLFPALYTLADKTNDWEKFIAVLEEALDLLHDDVNNFSQVWDPYKCDKKYLPYLAHKVGWLLDTSKPEYLQRKTTRLIGQVFKKQGTKIGLVEAIRLLLGFEAQVVETWATDGWRLGVSGRSNLRKSTRLASEEGPNPYHFTVIIPAYLTEAEEAALHEIIKMMKPAWTHYTLVANAWRLGKSKLARTTILGIDRNG